MLSLLVHWEEMVERDSVTGGQRGAARSGGAAREGDDADAGQEDPVPCESVCNCCIAFLLHS